MSYAISSLNKVILIGRLGADVEVKYMPNKSAQAKLNLATSERWKDKDGKNHEKTEWHRVVAWRQLAEFAGEWLKKGQMVCVEGSLKTRTWEQDGEKKYMTEVVADNITMLGGKENATPESNQTPKTALAVTDDDDDLPF